MSTIRYNFPNIPEHRLDFSRNPRLSSFHHPRNRSLSIKTNSSHSNTISLKNYDPQFRSSTTPFLISPEVTKTKVSPATLPVRESRARAHSTTSARALEQTNKNISLSRHYLDQKDVYNSRNRSNALSFTPRTTTKASKSHKMPSKSTAPGYNPETEAILDFEKRSRFSASGLKLPADSISYAKAFVDPNHHDLKRRNDVLCENICYLLKTNKILEKRMKSQLELINNLETLNNCLLEGSSQLFKTKLDLINENKSYKRQIYILEQKLSTFEGKEAIQDLGIIDSTSRVSKAIDEINARLVPELESYTQKKLRKMNSLSYKGVMEFTEAMPPKNNRHYDELLNDLKLKMNDISSNLKSIVMFNLSSKPCFSLTEKLCTFDYNNENLHSPFKLHSPSIKGGLTALQKELDKKAAINEPTYMKEFTTNSHLDSSKKKNSNAVKKRSNNSSGLQTIFKLAETCLSCKNFIESINALLVDNDFYRETNSRLESKLKNIITDHNILVDIFLENKHSL